MDGRVCVCVLRACERACVLSSERVYNSIERDRVSEGGEYDKDRERERERQTETETETERQRQRQRETGGGQSQNVQTTILTLGRAAHSY